MQIVTTHVNADFDALASVVAATFLYPQALGLLPRLIQPKVKEFLAIHKDLFKLTSRKDLNLSEVTKLIVVDTNNWNRLDQMEELQKRTDLEVILWDHHMKGGNIESSWKCQQESGANITLMVREMHYRDCAFAPMQATLFLMGLYDDTGNLTYPSTTPADAHTAAYLLENGADLNVAGAYLTMSFDADQAHALKSMLDKDEIITISGCQVGISHLTLESGSNMLSAVVNKYRELKGLDAAFGIFCTGHEKCFVIGRANNERIDLGAIFRKLGGGGHPGAGSVLLKTEDADDVYCKLLNLIKQTELPSIRVKQVMSLPKIALTPTTSMAEARLLLQKHHLQVAPIVEDGCILGIISSTEITKAQTDSQFRAPVKGFMKTSFPSLHPDQNAREAVNIMAEVETGLIPVVEENRLIGVITRADLMLYIYEL